MAIKVEWNKNKEYDSGAKVTQLKAPARDARLLTLIWVKGPEGGGETLDCWTLVPNIMSY